MHTKEKEFFILVLIICFILGIILLFFLYSILKYHRRDLRNKLEMIYGTEGILEEEKRRVGRDIHDGVSSGLAGIRLMLESINVQTEIDRIKVQEISSALDYALINLRYVMNGLMEVSIRNQTLPEVLSSYIEKYNMNSWSKRLKISYNFESQLDFSLEKSNHIYRIFQEVIANAEKHALAENLLINAKDTEDYTIISFRDDGHGFDTESVLVKSAGIGLNNIRFRAGIINATCLIHSVPKVGTEIILKVLA